MTYAEFKEKFLPQLNDIRSFAGKKRLADQYLTRIGSGSGRAVYDIDGEKVLKLALNRKGIAQNEVESGMMNDYYIKDLITQVFDAAEDNSWIVAEKAKKVTKKRIEELEDIPDFTRMAEFLIDFERSNKSRQSYQRNDFTQEEKEFFWDENDFSSSLLDFIGNYGQSAGDMGRPSSYGEVIRDGQPAIVLTDYGLNDEVFDTHYSGKDKQRYPMYELFQFADGNDDILSDIGSAQEIKHGMWAQMPYSVSDGDGVINMLEGQQKEFVNFVNNRNRYPDKSISDLPELTDRFHECVNNLKTVLESVEDKKKFYGNLLELQGYLIRRGFYNREPLVSEKYIIREDTPKVEPNTLNDRSYADELVKEVADKLNLTTPKYLGSGGYGFAYEIDDNVVLKITSDVSEADAASKLIRANPEHLSEIYNLYKIHDTENDKSFFVILQENISDKPVDKIKDLQNTISEINPSGMHYEDILVDIRKPNRFDLDEWQEFAKQILTANPDSGVGELQRQAAYEYLMDILKIRQELIDYGIKSTDYITINNLGYKNGKLKFFDIGGYVSRDEPNISDTDVIQIPESQQIDEKYDRQLADKIADRVGEKMGLEPRYLGGGEFGVAYDIGDNKVLKITRDNSEAQDNLRMIGKPLKYVAQPYRVFEIKTNKDPSHPTYGIILEKLRTDDEYFNRMYDRLDYVFDKIFGVRFKDAAEAIHDNEELPNDVKREDVDNYFKKNPRDGEFFYSLLRIWDEVEKYGSQSLDFFNPDNLGYKPSGLIGFFDVGFGDGFSQPNAEKIDVDINEDGIGEDDFPPYKQGHDNPPLPNNAVDANVSSQMYEDKNEISEDGTSIYSTDDEIGTDGFPAYNNSNIPPTINNNLDANSAMYKEDLEYNHASDATQDQYVLTEERLDDFVLNNEKSIDVYRNPKSIKRMTDYLRGILDREGNLYVINDSFNVIHNVFAEWLNLKGHPVAENTYYNLDSTVPLQRYGNTNTFYLSESLNEDEIRDNLEDIIPIIKRGKQKNPQYNFIVKSINDAEPNEDTPLFEDRKKSWVTGSKAVTVKQKCRLGGKADGTSVACNQGDISNLEFSSLKEDVELDSGFVQGWHKYEILHNDDVAGIMEVSNRDKYMILNKILINPEHRGMGHANDAMKLLTDYADQNNKIVALTPDTVWGASKGKLIKWYKSWGFVMNKGRNADYQVREMMIRYPEKSTQINEVGEGSAEPYEVKIIKSTDNNKVYGFKTEDNDRYEIEFNRGSLDDNEWDVIFGVKGQEYTQITNQGRLYRVMATILKIMNGFFANTKPDMLVIEPIKNKSGDFRRFLLYLSYIEKNLPQGYEMVKNNKEIIIQRSDWDEKYELEEYYSSLVPRVDEGMGVHDLPFKEAVEAEGGQIYVVGGTLRDQMLGRPSKDLDIVIRGIPEDQLAHILNKYGTVNAVGESFSVTKFVPEGSNEEIDIALPRTEVSTGEGHKDFEIKADHRLPIEKDLERRDFTINAIAQDMEGNLIDPFNGQQDLKAGEIKITHPKSFEDDALRMLRAVRFASVLGFNIDPETYKLIKESADKFSTIANDRVQTEFTKIAEQGDAKKGAFLLKDTGILREMGVDAPQLVSNVWDNVNTLAEFVYLLSHNAMSPLKFYMNNMRGDNDIVNELEGLIIGMSAEGNDNPVINRSVAHNMITKDKTGNSLQSKILPEKLQIAAQELLQGKYPKDRKDLAINGHDMMEKGLKGEEIGKMERALLINVYADKVRNTREDLLALLDERKEDVKEGYDYYSEPQNTWRVNGAEQNVQFFVKEYDKWNGGYHTDPTRETVKQFLNTKFRELANDDKLNKYLYWELIDRELLNEDNVKRVSYSGVVLDDKSRTDLLKIFAPMIPEDWETIAHHMTIKMGGLEDGSEEKQDMEDQKEVVLNVMDYAMDDKVLAVGVEGYNSLNEKPHITIAVNRQGGGKPFMSNNLTNWKPLGFPLKLTGKVTEV